MREGRKTLIVIATPGHRLAWHSVDDVVMGGRSASSFAETADGHVLFQGFVSLDDGGGFASGRAATGGLDLSGCAGIGLRIRGDGKRYRFRLKDDERLDGVVHQAGFDTRDGLWRDLRLSFGEFVPTLRGRTAGDAAPLDLRRVAQVGLLVADRQEGPFRLEIERIVAYPATG